MYILYVFINTYLFIYTKYHLLYPCKPSYAPLSAMDSADWTPCSSSSTAFVFTAAFMSSWLLHQEPFCSIATVVQLLHQYDVMKNVWILTAAEPYLVLSSLQL